VSRRRARKQLVEASVGLVQAALHARGKHPVALFRGVEEWRPSSPLVRSPRSSNVTVSTETWPGMPSHSKGLDDALSGRHLLVGPAEPALAAVRSGAVTCWQVPRNPLSLPSGLRMMNRQLPPFRTSIWSTRWSSRADPTTLG
jgi:hypothetical protein